MDRIRARGPTGHVVAVSVDGSTFVTTDGAAFAERTDQVLNMVDGSVGTLVGAVVFMQNEVGEQVRAYWLEPAPDDPE